MRLRRRNPILYLLLPALVAAVSIPDHSKRDAAAPRDVADVEDAVSTESLKPPALKAGWGTKDAPVDGLDGKPHAGPWIVVDSDTKKKPLAGGEDIGPKIPASVARLEKEGYGGRSSEQGWRLIPDKNDGVMDDTNRLAPKKGTTGTEGGVSEKEKMEKANELMTGEKAERMPDSPRKNPPLPDIEEERLKDSFEGKQRVKGTETKTEAATTTSVKARGAQGMQKPTDLPDKPRDKTTGSKAEPKIAPGRKKLVDTMPYTEGSKSETTSSKSTPEDADGLIQPLHSLLLAFVMILFSEIGDKTFLVAALMAMRHDRIVVFSAAFSALIAMTVLSAVVGHAVPTLLPKRFVSFAAAILFLVFGAKMLREGLQMPKDSGVGEEMKEVEAELEEKEHAARQHERRGSTISPFALEAGRGRRSHTRGSSSLPEKPRSPSASSSERSPSPSSRRTSLKNTTGGLNNLLSLILSPAWVQTFIMTFLGEWGDRSQIATVAMAAGQDYWWVTGGAVGGHAICTGIAVIGGRALAGRVSMRVVTIGGAVAFLVFGVIYLLEAIYAEVSSTPH